MGSVFADFPHLRLGLIADVEPAGRRTMAAFMKSDTPGENSEAALWHHKTTVTQSMAAHPDTGISAIPAEAQSAAKYWRQRGAFLLPQRLCLPVTRTMAVRLPAPALGGARTHCKHRHWDGKETVEKSLCSFLNSSIGIGEMLGNRSNKTLTYPRRSLTDLRRLRVPNFADMGVGYCSTCWVVPILPAAARIAPAAAGLNRSSRG